MRQPIQVLIYPVKTVGSKWEYLLLRRTASRGGFWQGVTGGVEEDEGVVEAATRELFEETGCAKTGMYPGIAQTREEQELSIASLNKTMCLT